MPGSKKAEPPPPSTAKRDDLEALRDQMAAMQQKLDSLIK